MVITILAVLVLMLFGTRGPTSYATPAPDATPPATDCTVQPRSLGAVNEIGSMGSTPVSGTPDLDEPIEYIKPEGTPAPDQTFEAVTATLELFVACVNAGDYLRFLALFSDNFIRTYASDIGVPLVEDDPMLTPEPVEADSLIRIDEIADVIELPDRRVNALVTISIADDSEDPVTIVFTFAYDENRERWLIDDFREVRTTQDLTSWMVVQGDGYEGVIVPEDRAGELTDYYVSEPVDGFWTPTEDDIEALELSLPVYLRTEAANLPGIRPDFNDRLPEYKRQYAGFIQNGRRLILVNATCDDDFNWETQPVIVMDGGDCFFRITRDPDAGTFEDFEVNGEA